jgi:hypothetical protein
MTESEKKQLLHNVLMFPMPFRCKDEPYMDFYCEVQGGVLMAAYCTFESGDVIHDPLLHFYLNFQKAEVTKITYFNDLAGIRYETDANDEFAWRFLKTVYDRHLAKTLRKVASQERVERNPTTPTLLSGP